VEQVVLVQVARVPEVQSGAGGQQKHGGNTGDEGGAGVRMGGGQKRRQQYRVAGRSWQQYQLQFAVCVEMTRGPLANATSSIRQNITLCAPPTTHHPPRTTHAPPSAECGAASSAHGA